MPAFSMAGPLSQPVRAASRKLEFERALKEKLDELEVERDKLQQQLDHDEAKAMELLEQFLPLPDGLEQAVRTAMQDRDNISAEWERYNHVLRRFQGAKDVPLSPQDEELLEKALAWDDSAEVPAGKPAAGRESSSIGAAEAKEARENEEHMAKARKYEWNSGLGLNKASSSMFAQGALDQVLNPEAGVVSDAELDDVDDESEVSNSQIDAGLLDEDGEPRRRARSWSTGSNITVYRPPTPEGDPELGGMQQISPSPTPRRGQNQTSPGFAESGRGAALQMEDYQRISRESTPAEIPIPRKLNLGTGLRRKSGHDAQDDLPLFRARTPPMVDLDDDLFEGSPGEMSHLHQEEEDPRAATSEELPLEEMSNASRASSESSDGLFVSEKTPWVPPRERARAHHTKGPSAKCKDSLATAAHPSSGLHHLTQKHPRVNAEANFTQHPPSLRTKVAVAPSISRKRSPVACLPTPVSVPSPTEVSSTSTIDQDLPLGNPSWNFDAVDAAQAEAAALTSDQTSLALRAKNETKHRTTTPDSNTSARPLKQKQKQKPQRPLKPKKSVRFADDADADGLLYPTAGGKSFQLIGQQAKGPLLPTPEQAKGDWTYFMKMPSKLKRKAGDVEEAAKVEGSLGAYNRKKTKVVDAKNKCFSLVEAGDADDSEPEQGGTSKPAHMRGSSPKAGKKKAIKKTKCASAIENDRSEGAEEKTNKSTPEDSKKEAPKPKENLEETMMRIIMEAAKTSGKKRGSGFFGPEQ
ncbi:uncharacterized protein MYCFIDRAFT_199926 [Pseudocercospora fijiensis CIRAD86]|uniref:Uncharacterized protein n=1 Tax=Pseudocercospora fijiensis (strain CIRAD86) TaxID=383855 RepID=M3ANY3_PSEFD|nr:uncharacterized protein MYCFIDRAFT_199926 [Pseudocercospora fijiensis CIRAD86]EME78818.1 hypothetical protein MYCFIDRAFT_199926 [Pseudocercospora fijiensis CIRAD86]